MGLQKGCVSVRKCSSVKELVRVILHRNYSDVVKNRRDMRRLADRLPNP